MDITSPSYMIGSWVFWASIILPTMYLNSEEEMGKKDQYWIRLIVLFGQFVVTGGLMALAPSVRPFLINPIPLISIILTTYVLKYSVKITDRKKIIQWVTAGSLAISIIIPQLIVMVKKGYFVGGKYSGLEPGTMAYTTASFVVWAIIILQMLSSKEGAKGSSAQEELNKAKRMARQAKIKADAAEEKAKAMEDKANYAESRAMAAREHADAMRSKFLKNVAKTLEQSAEIARDYANDARSAANAAKVEYENATKAVAAAQVKVTMAGAESAAAAAAEATTGALSTGTPTPETSMPGTPTPGTVATPGTSTPGTVATPGTPAPAPAPASNNTSRKTKFSKVSEDVKKSFDDISKKIGINELGIGSFIPVIFKILILLAFASIPDAREFITSPVVPAIAVLGYVVLRWLNIATTIEIVAIALVSFLPQLRTLILNPIPPIIIPTTYMALNTLGTSSDKIAPLAGVVGFAVTLGLQFIQDSLPIIISTTGLTLETGTFFYNNFSSLAWFLIIVPSTYFFLRVDKNSKPSIAMSKETKDIIQIAQAVLIGLLAAGIQSFKGLFLNPTPPLAFMLILGFHLMARAFNWTSNPTNSEYLVGMLTLFGYGSNLVVGDKIVEMLYSGGFPEPPTVEVQEPQMPELQVGDPSPINITKITSPN